MDRIRREKITLPEELDDDVRQACLDMGLTVVAVPHWEDQAILREVSDLEGRGVPFMLFVAGDAGPELTEHIIKQSLADLGHPDFTDVAIEPFGRLPNDPRPTPWKGPDYPDPAWRPEVPGESS